MLVLVLSLSQSHLSAQNKTVIKVNPLSFFVTTINLQVEHALNENMSIQLGGFYGGLKTSFFSGAVNVNYKHFGITPEFRYYFIPGQSASPSGFYGAAFFRYRQLNAKSNVQVYDPDSNTEFAGKLTNVLKIPGGGAMVGYQFLFNDIVALDMFLGPQFSSAKISSTIECSSCDGNETWNAPNFKFGGVGLRAGLSIGVAF